MGWNLIAILGGLGGLAAIIALLASRVDEGSALARIWAWLQQSRKEREALRRRIKALEEHVNLMSTLLQTHSNLRDAEYQELKALVADLKLRVDADGKRLTTVEGNIVHDALILDTLGTALKDARILIAGLQMDDLKIYKAGGETYRKVNDRLRKLEGLPPSGYIGQVSLSDLPDPNDTADSF